MVIITVNGLRFSIECAGFESSEPCKAVAEDQAESMLRALSAAGLKAAHAADMAWVNDDCATDRPTGCAPLEKIEARARELATKGWYRADDTSVAVHAEPTKARGE